MLENTSFKVLTKILTTRLTAEVDRSIPECQFGFRKGRSTLQAVSNLTCLIEDTLRHTKRKYHVVFVDFKKAFDRINRQILIKKLGGLIGSTDPITMLISNILLYNYVQINEEGDTSNKIKQTNGVLRGDPISPLLFNIITADIAEIKENKASEIIMYADDVKIVSESNEELQKTLENLAKWADRNNLEINIEKTVTMTFKKGGKQAQGYTLYISGNKLEFVKQK